MGNPLRNTMRAQMFMALVQSQTYTCGVRHAGAVHREEHPYFEKCLREIITEMGPRWNKELEACGKELFSAPHMELILRDDFLTWHMGRHLPSQPNVPLPEGVHSGPGSYVTRACTGVCPGMLQSLESRD